LDIAQAVAVWLHTLAFVIAWGYYGILGRMVLPGLERALDGRAEASVVAAIEGRALPVVVLSLVLFTVTGSYLLVIDPQYRGLGDVFASTWTALMLIKHLLVVGLIVLGVAVDRLARRAGNATTDPERSTALHRLRLSTEAATGLGALIVLVTAAAQVSS